MGSLGIVNAYAMRICLSLTITAMVIPTNTSLNGTGSDVTCAALESTSPRSNGSGTFEWDEHTQESIKSNKISRTNVRKIFTTMATLGSAVFMMVASYAGCNHPVVIILFTFSMGMAGFFYPGVMTNPLDLCPNYSGTIMAFVTIIISLCGMMVPYMVGVLTPNQALTEWRIAFWVTFVVVCVSAVIYDLWADGEVQYWNDLDSQVDKQKKFEDKEEDPFLKISSKCNKTFLENAE